jgi:hypothetical protein
MPDGAIKKMGFMEYKIRKVPKPQILFGSLAAGSWEKSKILQQQFLYAYLDDFYFSGIRFSIEKFRITLDGKRTLFTQETITGNSLNRAVNMIKTARSGDIIYIDEIVVNGPSGIIRPDPFTLKVK